MGNYKSSSHEDVGPLLTAAVYGLTRIGHLPTSYIKGGLTTTTPWTWGRGERSQCCMQM